MGAIGAHALERVLSPEDMKSYQTAIFYQFIHLIVLFFLNHMSQLSEGQMKWINSLMGAGILLFSGSIYLIKLTPVEAKTIWWTTPLGGLLLISGWFLIALYYFKL
jgi:uncharacterized membrane protein YgdD (TMEM256/DUF423 family)